METQKAINQALIKLQLLINTFKVFVEEKVVSNVNDFINEINKVSSVVVVDRLEGIKVEAQTKEAIAQYTIIDKALERAQNLLSITDSFLGASNASDSGRKVKLQQNTTKVALNYIVLAVELFYRSLGNQLLNLIKTYYSANQIISVVDKKLGQRFIEINQPFISTTETGEEVPLLNIEKDEDGKYKSDKDGNIIISPEPIADTAIQLLEGKINIVLSPYADEDERNQLFLEGTL